MLVTGASGYIGGRLVPELLARGYRVRVMVRAASPVYKERWPEAEIAVADALEIDRLREALEGVDTAYYLIHSLLLGPRGFASADIKAAANFRRAAEEKKVRRIIYLGGLGDTQTQLSSHLQSRIHVAEELKQGTVPVTILQAAIIIGSGSASDEIIQHLVRRLPIIPIPRWAKTRCQPIAIRDVIRYLVGVLETPEAAGKSFHIGGNDVLTYEDMLKIRAKVMNKKRLFVPFMVSNIRFYSYVGSLLTPVPDHITRCLIEGLKNEVVCQDNSIRQLLPFQPLGHKEAIIRTMNRVEQDDIRTRWSDAYPPAHELALRLHECKEVPKFTASYSLVTEKAASALFQSICKVGGRGGWFSNNWMWRLRGAVDRILLGVGTSRGRRSQTTLKINDVIDFWRTEDLQMNRRLLLRAEMKLPGRAWLEFNIQEGEGVGHAPLIQTGEGKRRLSVAAHYFPHGLWGEIYWYLFLPFHRLLFNDLIKQIERRS
ncbi:MAG: SDR family oxidoreductase [Candidatus Eisenbacteria bacterium]|nr:SDR family oxidoreductase [Candidatus Eisenbacteria bacterium]